MFIVNDDSYGIRLGYSGDHQPSNDPNRITLTATDKGEVVGTLSIGIDSEVGLMADEVFGAELDAHRANGARLCEFTKFAFDPSVRSKTALANVFHLAVIYARDMHGCTDIIIEVNPRHRRFYERMLGFRKEGELKINTRVDAPAYLLRVNLKYVTEQISIFGGTFAADGETEERSFYPYFFSPREERGIINRLLRMDESHPA
jgi:hypothetical protein